MATRTSRRTVALSASAIATIYAAGFMLTRSADASLTAASAAVPSTASVASGTLGNRPTAVVGASAAPGAVAGSTALKDGSYTGQGTSRRGGVSVSVTVSNGAIANVQITGVSTQYPVSRIASLPGAVVKQQNANVNTISGATYSSQAFKQAVQQALTVAQSSSGPVTG